MAVLFRSRWVNHFCHPACTCGWTGEPCLTLKAAKAIHARHVRDDCPIGNRTPAP